MLVSQRPSFPFPRQSKRKLIFGIVTAFIAVFLNLVLSEEIEDEAASITANEVDAADDQEEWARIKRGKAVTDEEIGEKTETEDGKDITPKV